jgi:N-acetylmuramoyl-L-alanine amidase
MLSDAECSGMLSAVRSFSRPISVLALSLGCLFCVLMVKASSFRSQEQQTPPIQQSLQQHTSQAQPPSPVAPAPGATSKPAYHGPIIVLDPAHGGTDTGARGESGAIEKDLVLDYARMVRSELESQGFHVVQTRNDDSNPSYADRAAVANAYQDAIFISLHVSSTGPFGTARTYYGEFGSAPNGTTGARDASSRNSPHDSLVRWNEAQLTHVAASHRLADTLQAQLAQRFNGSPAVATPAAVRGLRSVNAPAVAIEISSVSVPDANALPPLASALAVSIARGLQAFVAASSQKAK